MLRAYGYAGDRGSSVMPTATPIDEQNIWIKARIMILIFETINRSANFVNGVVSFGHTAETP